VKANGDSAGVDGVSLEEVERQGVALYLAAIAGDLKAGRYKPQPVLRVYIPTDEDCRTAGFGKTERPVGWEGNGELVMMRLMRHCNGETRSNR
jgi:hypothetical protein